MSSTTGFQSILPSTFGQGIIDLFLQEQVVNGQTSFYAIPSALSSYNQSRWDMAQWGQSTPLVTSNYTLNNTALSDPVLGTPQISWSNPGAVQSLAEWNTGTAQNPNYVYGLTDGSQPAEGDFFLQANPTSTDPFGTANLSEMTNVSMSLKITKDNWTAGTSNNIDVGIIVSYDGANGTPKTAGFVQIVPYTSSAAGGDKYSASYLNLPGPTSTGSMPAFISTYNRNDPILPMLPSDAYAKPITLQYNVNKYAQDAIDVYYSQLPASVQGSYDNLANWRVTGFYIGPTTNNLSGGTTDSGSMSVQISNVHLTADSSTPFVAGSSPTGSETVPGPVINFTNYLQPPGTVVMGLFGSIAPPTPETGTVEGAAMTAPGGAVYDRYIYNGGDPIALTAPGSTAWNFGGGTGSDTLVGNGAADTLVGGAQGGLFSPGGAGSVLILNGGSNTIAGSITGDTVSVPSGVSLGNATVTTNGPGQSTVELYDTTGNAVLSVTASMSPDALMSALGVNQADPAFLINGSGFQTIDASASSVDGSYTIAAGGTVLVTTGGGTNTILSTAGQDTVQMAGNNTVTLDGGTSWVKNENGKSAITINGAASVIATNMNGYAGSMDITISGRGGSAPVLLNGNEGSVTVSATDVSASNYLTLGGGAAGNNFLTSQNAPAVLVGGGDGDTLIAGAANGVTISETNYLFAGHGNETLIASANTTTNLFQARAGVDMISTDGSGVQYFFSGNAAATMVGSTVSGSQNVFFFGNPTMGAGTNYIDNFRVGQDVLIATNGTSIESMTNQTFNSTPGTLVTLSDGTVAFLKGVAASGVASIAAGTNFTSL